jgi:hypothetical protein
MFRNAAEEIEIKGSNLKNYQVLNPYLKENINSLLVRAEIIEKVEIITEIN